MMTDEDVWQEMKYLPTIAGLFPAICYHVRDGEVGQRVKFDDNITITKTGPNDASIIMLAHFTIPDILL